MTSIAIATATPRAGAPVQSPSPALRILSLATIVSAVVLVGAVTALLLDQRLIDGAPAWLKPVKFGIAITAYLVTLRWMLGFVTGHRRLLTVLAIVTTAVFAFETAWIDTQVLRGTTSHFNEATAGDAAAYYAAGGAISLVFLATMVVGVLLWRQRGLDAGIAAGIRWGLAVSVLGMAEAISMTVNRTAGDSGGHTVGAPDGGPGMPLTDWSLLHGDLRVAHFVGLHALQALPILAWLLARTTRLDGTTRVRLVRIAAAGTAGLVVLLWWQAERGQALLSPDALTLTAGAALAAAVGTAAALVLMLRRRAAAESSA
ncbi:hypothetical protein [Naasia aerilata]|nr:hypothetical protein [Naasia aerilata]